MIEQDQELREWTEDWLHAETAVPIDAAAVRHAVRRRTIQLGVTATIEFAILATVLVGLVVFARATRDPWDLSMVVAFSALIFAAAGRGIAVLRRTWRAHDESTRAFVDLMALRADTQLRQARFGWFILAVEIAVFVPWLWHTTRAAGVAVTAGAYGFLAVAVAVAAAVLLVLKKRAQRDLDHWSALQREFKS